MPRPESREVVEATMPLNLSGMRALTTHQPWADLLVDGRKPIETRTWPTSYRGPLLIHSSRNPIVFPGDVNLNGLDPRRLSYGCVLGRVDLVDVRPLVPIDEAAALCPWSPGRYAWVVSNPQRFEEPIPMRGYQRLWTVR
jgi:hypothetical protein